MIGAMNGIWDVLFGKPQSWYANIDRIQKKLVVANSGVTETGDGIWDTIASKYRYAIGGPPYFSGYAATLAEIVKQMNAIMVTENKTPSDASITDANQKADYIQGMVEYAKRVAPEVRRSIEAEQARVTGLVDQMTPMKSPAEVGRDAFVKTLAERANLFGGIGIGIAAAVLVGLFLLSRILR